MDTLILYGRLVAPFALDCAVKVSVAAIAALLAAHGFGRRRPASSFGFIVTAFALAAVLVIARAQARPEIQPWASQAATAAPGPAALAPQGEPAPAPALTATPGLTAKYGSMFQVRIGKPAPEREPAAGAASGTLWIPALGLVWGVGFGVLSLHHLLGILATSRLVRRSRPCGDRRLLKAAEAVRLSLDAVHTKLRMSSRCRAAFVTGCIHPCIVLPAEAVDWPPARRTSTLLHEYLHVRRWDVPVAEGLRLITTLAWFSPFPWFALSLALKLREQACDGAVLRAGIARAAYATDLLDAARSLARPRPAASASICAGSSLEIRIRAVLEDPLVQPLRDRLARTAAAGALLAGALGMARSAGPLYSIPEFSSREALPRGPGEWGAGADPRPGGTTLQGAFSLSLEGDYARIRLRFRGRLREFRLPAAALPGSLPLSGRARMIVPFGDLVDDQARKPFFNPGWSIWDGRQVPVRAAAPGRVLATRIDPRYGLVIEVDHGAGLRTRYGLGRQGVSNVVAGEYVSPWAPIGTLGACSPYDLPVLNFSILVQFGAERVALDPAPFLLAQAESRGTPLCASVVNAAVRLQDRAELERLIAGGAALNHPSADGTLPLEWALMNGNLAIAKDLVAAGADPRAATWNVHQAHIALHGPTVAELARDSANPAFAALLAPVQGTAGARSPAGAPNLWH